MAGYEKRNAFFLIEREYNVAYLFYSGGVEAVYRLVEHEKLRMPQEGDAVTAGESLGDVESVKAVSDIICPVTGVVEEVNEDLADAPENLNSDPYGSWIIKVKDVEATEELLDAAAYEAFCATEEA